MQVCQTAACTLRDQEGRRRSFRYLLTSEQYRTGNVLYECYGISISEEGGERACVPALTHSFSRARALMSMLVRNGVGPAALYDVVEDWEE